MNGDREMGRDRASEGKGMKERENSQQGAERQRGVGGLGAPGQPTYHPPCPPSRYWVRLGEHSLSKLDWTEQIRRSGLSVTHPSYRGNLGNHDNDLRLLRLGTPVRLTTSVQPLPLPRPREAEQTPQGTLAAPVLGKNWGRLQEQRGAL